jgi:hypothetical protein
LPRNRWTGFFLREETRIYRQAVLAGMVPALDLTGFLVATCRRVEDLWLHWDAKSVSFDTALGYSHLYLLAGGVSASTDLVRASAHRSRGQIHGARRTLHTCAEAMPPEETGMNEGQWRPFTRILSCS